MHVSVLLAKLQQLLEFFCSLVPLVEERHLDDFRGVGFTSERVVGVFVHPEAFARGSSFGHQ